MVSGRILGLYYVQMLLFASNSDTPLLYKSVHRTDIDCGGGVLVKGCTFLHNERLLLADYKGSRLLVFDAEYKFLRHHAIDVRPNSICTSEALQLVHVLGDIDPTYCVVSYAMTNDQCEEQSRFRVDGGYRLAVVGNSYVVEYKGNINIYNQCGDKINTFRTPGCVNAVCSSSLSNVMYHNEFNQLVCRRVDDGEVVSKFTDPSLGLITGMCCDRDGSLYCIDSKNRSVYRTSPDLKTGRVVLETVDDIENPDKMCYHPNNDVFVVTNMKTLSNKGLLFNVYNM